MTNPVFELNDWVLCKSQTKSPRRLYAKHLNCIKEGEVVGKTRENGTRINQDTEHAWLEEEPPVCYNCNNAVPDEIQTLMYLHEWNTNIQYP